MALISMSGTGGMPMPGGWTMSMMWMRMPGQTWLSAAASFVGMWIAMMVAMMLPSLLPTLWRYRDALHALGERRTLPLTARVALAYFFVWAVLGMVAFPLGAVLADVAMRQPAAARAVPLAAAVVALIARYAPVQRVEGASARMLPGGASQCDRHTYAWRFGLRLGLRCALCCAGLMAVLFAVGIMNLQAMGSSDATLSSTASSTGPSWTRHAESCSCSRATIRPASA